MFLGAKWTSGCGFVYIVSLIQGIFIFIFLHLPSNVGLYIFNQNTKVCVYGNHYIRMLFSWNKGSLVALAIKNIIVYFDKAIIGTVSICKSYYKSCTGTQSVGFYVFVSLQFCHVAISLLNK